MSRLQQDSVPGWETFVASHTTGDTLQGRVMKVVPFGAFIEVADGVSGLLVVEERPVEGSTVTVEIKEIDAERRRLSFVSA